METVDIMAVNDVLRKKFINGQMRSNGERGAIQGEIFEICYEAKSANLCVFFWWLAVYREVEEADCVIGSWHIPPENVKRIVGAKIKMSAHQAKHVAEDAETFGTAVIYEPYTKESYSQTEFFPPGHEEDLKLEWIQGAVSASSH